MYDTVVLAVDEIEDLPGSVRPTADKAAERKYPGKSSTIKVAELLELVKGDAEKYIPKQEIVREASDESNPDIRYSRELTADGRVVAVVDEDILSNLDLSNWNQETKETAQKAATRALLKFKGGIAVDGITRKVNRISRKEFTRSEYTNELFWWNSTAFLDKMRAANNLDDIVIAATDWARDGALKHPRTDNLVDFDHGTTLIASGDAKYEAEVVVGITDKGEAVFYDIVNMKPGNFSIKKEEPSPTVTTNKSPDSIFEDSSTSTVAQQEQNVNQKHSRELETVEELKQQNELLKKQVDYWHSQTAVTVGERGADKEEVKKLARQLRRDYGSQTEVSDYLPELQWLADNRQNKKARFADMMQTAENVARQVLDGCRVNVNEEQMETMKELKKFLRGRYINVNDSLKEDIGDFGDFKKLNRALHFREDGSGTGVDSLWLELQDQFGKGLFPEDVQNPADQIRHIADTVGTMEAQWVNPYDADMELTVQQMANDVMAKTLNLNRMKGTRADKAAEQATKELTYLLEKGRKRELRRIEGAQQTAQRQSIRGMAEKFKRMALKPGKGDTQHAPQQLIGAVTEFCEVPLHFRFQNRLKKQGKREKR